MCQYSLQCVSVLLFIAETYIIVWIEHILPFYQLMDIYFYLLAVILNNAAMDIHIHIFVWKFSLLLHVYLEMKLWVMC